MRSFPKPPGRPPLFMLLFMSIFGFIGLTVLIFLWTDEGFGSPPLFFRVFGSFIALAFIMMGFGMPLSLLFKSKRSDGGGDFSHTKPTVRKPGSYDCPNCGANVGDVEVSPSGDIKCGYCNEWWNIHSRSHH